MAFTFFLALFSTSTSMLHTCSSTQTPPSSEPPLHENDAFSHHLNPNSNNSLGRYQNYQL